MQSFKTRAAAALVAATAAIAGPALAAGWDEAVDGDFSNDGLVPTAISLQPGITDVLGATGRAVTGGPVDRDYFTVVVPAGFVLESLVLKDGVSVVGGGSFLGLQAGSQVTVSPTGNSAAGLLGWTVYTVDNIDSDLLFTMSFPALGSSGFDVPLPAGTYSFWVQETGVGTASYHFALSMAAVPELPPALGLLGGLAVLAAVKRRR